MKTHILGRACVRVPFVLAALVSLAVVALAGCGGSAGSSGRHTLTVGLTYVPNIQFAPFYVADALGYYKDAGLDVTFRHHAPGEDEFAALVAGREDAIFAAGDEIIGARASNVPIVDIATVYTRYPVALIVPASSPIQSAADLRGRRIGIPGKYGATYIGLLALLKSAGLTENDVNLQTIGYTQVPALLTRKVDAVMGYTNNEPIQLRKAGMAVRTLDVNAVQPLVSNGLAALEKTLKARDADLRALVKATLRGVDYMLAHPNDAVKRSARYVPGLDDAAKQADALAVLQATLPFMQPASKPGYNDPATWDSMVSFLKTQGLLKASVDAKQAYSNEYLP